MGLVYRCDDLSNPCMWSDATWAPDYGTFYDNYRTTELKSVVAQSSAASEWYAAADIAKEAEFLRNLFSDLGMPQNGAIPLLSDNQSTMGQTLNAVDQHSSRHLGMRSHFLSSTVSCWTAKVVFRSFPFPTRRHHDQRTSALSRVPAISVGHRFAF